MDADFSEFSYGYAAIREAESALSTIYTSAGAPKLPTLVEEADLGYDARIAFVDFVLFLQFKRPQFVSRKHKNSPTWGGIGRKHYRYSIDTDGHQYEALLNLEIELAKWPTAANVYYAAPVFHRQSDFDSAYARGSVLEKSSLTLPSDFPTKTGVHHLVASNPGTAFVMSEPKQISTATWDSIQGRVRGSAARAAARSPREQMRVGDLEAVLRSSVRRLGRHIELDQDASVFSALHRSAALLGCGLALVSLDPHEG